MKHFMPCLMVVAVSGLGGAAAAAAGEDPHALEPCINGGVSASGLYPTQEAEDAAFAKAQPTAGDQEAQASVE